MRTEDCDILIIGGGPAGLIAAREAARARRSLSIIVLERDDAVGAPVRCGEGVGSAGLSEFLSPLAPLGSDSNGINTPLGGLGDDLIPLESDPSAVALTYQPWISRRITRVVFRSPNGSTVRVAEGDVGYILDRSRFEPVIAAQADAAGAEIRTRVDATTMRRERETWCVTVRSDAGEYQIRARIVIGADGVEGAVGRWAGIDTRVRARDMESCAQYVVDGVDIDADAIVLHFGDRVAPGGYAWVFPKGPSSANVGLGVTGLRADGRSAVAWLDHYVDAHFPHATRAERTVGGVIAAATVSRTFADGVMLCGDAAHMINPLSGGGIVNAMKAGRLAAETAVDALAANDTCAARLEIYHTRWMRLLGDDHVRFYQLKEALGKFDDAFYDRLAVTVNRIPESRRTLRRIFGEALVRHPSLLPVVFKYFV